MKFYHTAICALFILAFASCETDDGIGFKEGVPGIDSYTYSASGSIDGHDYVDLGLSVKWATCNVGAESPEQSGFFLAWGDVKPQTVNFDFSWASYSFCVESANRLLKYNTDPNYANDNNPDLVDGKLTLDPADDAAYQHWGAGWRMPSDAELTELRTNCKFVWANVNGRNGYQVIGPNGNSIFIPASGFYVDGNIAMENRNGCIWSSSLSPSTPTHAYEFTFYNGSQIRGSVDRFYGENVRPVVNTSAPSSGDTNPPSGGDDNPTGGDTNPPTGGNDDNNPTGGDNNNPTGGNDDNTPTGGDNNNPSGGDDNGGDDNAPNGGDNDNNSNDGDDTPTSNTGV